MRAADTDRQAVADKLKLALDEGRLDLGEYDERLQKTYAAKTYGDLNGLLDDLPGATLALQPEAAAPPEPKKAARQPEVRTRPGDVVRGMLGGFGGVFVLCTVIWLATSLGNGELEYFWPVWLLIPMAVGMLGSVSAGDRRHRGERRRGCG